MEVELKFQVPDAARAALRRAVATAQARTERLRARYLDTPDRRLAAAGVAARLRREGTRWVQTVKAGGGDAVRRLEHEVELPAQRGVPAFDIGRHAGTDAGDALVRALGADAPPLEVVFETDVRRTTRRVRAGGASVELALDVGEVRAGAARAPLHEIEFELKSGRIESLVALAARWADRHGLWLDARSKAERGQLLAAGRAASPPATAAPLVLPAAGIDAALRAMVGAALAHALPNASALAGEAGEAEHVHQLRVALRRLRSVLRLWGDAVPWASAPWSAALAELFTALGDTRDADVMRDSVQPALAEAGAPPFDWPLGGGDGGGAAGAVLRSKAATRLWLDLIAAAHGAPQAPGAAVPTHEPPLLDRLAPALRRLHRQLRRDARDYTAADIEQRHRTRRRIKRLRYGIEAIASLLPAKPLRRHLAALRPIQEALGAYNDLLVAEALLERDDLAEPGHWYARGWLAARRAAALDEAAEALRMLPPLPRGLKRAR